MKILREIWTAKAENPYSNILMAVTKCCEICWKILRIYINEKNKAINLWICATNFDDPKIRVAEENSLFSCPQGIRKVWGLRKTGTAILVQVTFVQAILVQVAFCPSAFSPSSL